MKPRSKYYCESSIPQRSIYLFHSKETFVVLSLLLSQSSGSLYLYYAILTSYIMACLHVLKRSAFFSTENNHRQYALQKPSENTSFTLLCIRITQYIT